jgi:hypothetical protein
MRELPLTAGEAAANLTQRVRMAELTEQHRDELTPTRKAAGVPVGVSRDDDALKLGPWKKLEQLIEDAAESRHRGEPPV